MKKALILMFIILMVGTPLMVFATPELHIEDIWYEDIDGTTVELYRYHNHFAHTPAGAVTSQLFCGIVSEVLLSETKVKDMLNANSLEAQILALSDLKFLDFHTNTPIDGSNAWIDVSTVTNVTNMDGYECMVYLDGEPAFTILVYVVGPMPIPPTATEVPTPEPTETPEYTDEIIYETEATTSATITFVTATPEPTPLPNNTPTPTATPEPTPTPELTPTPTPRSDQGSDLQRPTVSAQTPVGASPKTVMSAIEITGLCAEILATVAVGVSLISDLRIIRFCKGKGG